MRVGIDKIAGFNGGLLAFYIVCILLYVCVHLFLYPYYLSNSMKIYMKMKVNWITVFLLFFIFILFLVLAATFTVFIIGGHTVYFKNNLYCIPMSWVLVVISIFPPLFLWLVVKKINKNRKNIGNFSEENWQNILQNHEATKPSQEYLTKFQNRHRRYLSMMHQQYNIIKDLIINYNDKVYESTLSHIVIFNERFTTKWSKQSNYFQLKMFYELCILFQKTLEKFDKN